MLAETVRAAEELGAALDDPVADAGSRDAPGDFETKIAVRARALPATARLEAALRHVQSVAWWLIAAAIVVSLAAGAGAARTALGGERDAPVIFLPVLGGLLGIQTLLLILWLGLWLLKPRSLGGASLGGLVIRGARQAARLGTKSVEHLAAAGAYASVSLDSSIARWKTSVISHGLWTAFNVGCITLLLLLLSTRYYTFGWETTILPSGTYAPLIEAIGWLPGRAGFNVPGESQIAASQWTGAGEPPHEARAAWSGLLVGSMVVYGFVPRVMLLAASLIGLSRAQRRFRLDTSKAGYVRLRHHLMPPSAGSRVVDHEDIGAAAPVTEGVTGDARTLSDSAAVPIVGIEIDEPATGWPPRGAELSLQNLGRIDSRQQREQVLHSLRSVPARPSTLIAVCAVSTTPDRGVARLLEQLREAAGAPLTLVLTGGHALRQRGGDQLLAGRVGDWHQLARSIGIDASRVLELDLDHATDVSMQKLAEALGGHLSEEFSRRRIEEAFDAIIRHRCTWHGQPSDQQQLALHTDIAGLYRSSAGSWLKRVRETAGRSADVFQQARSGAARAMSLLPGNLRATSAWALAGATAGALGCVAVASLITPAALAALPGWSMVGGAVTTVLHAARQLTSTQAGSPEETRTQHIDGTSDAVRAALVFALLLELQGRPEQEISNVLGRTVRPDDAPPENPAPLKPWLDDVRHRFDLAIASQRRNGP